MKTRNNPWLRGSLLAASLFLNLSLDSHAATYDWSGASSANMSGTPLNWGGTTPAASDTARWNSSSYTNAPTANADMTIGQLLFGAGNTAGITFGGTSTLTLNGISGVGLQMNSGTGAINIGTTTTSTPKFKIGASQSWNNNDNSLLSIWGTITNSGNTTPYVLTIGGTGNIDLISGISNGGTTGSLAITKTGTGTLKLTGSNTFTGGLTVNQGTLLAQSSANAMGGSGTGVVNLGDTTGSANVLMQLGTSSTFNNPITVRFGSSGTATISNFSNYNPTLAATLTLDKGLTLSNTDSGAPFSQVLTVSGKVTGAGGLTLTGNNVGSQIVLANTTNDYLGSTAVNGGTFRLSGAIGGAVSIAAAAGIAGEGSISTGGSLTLADGSTLTADGKTSAALSVGGDLTFDATTHVVLEAAPATPGMATTIRLLDYTGTLSGGSTTFVLQNAANYRGHSFSTTTSNQINMTLDAKSIVWSGTSADWDVVTSLNWDSGAEKFHQGDAVTFNDDGTTKAVTLAASVMPASIIFNHSTGNDYSLTGTGVITGAATLTKTGTGVLTLSTPNTYSGGTTISDGKIVATVANALGTGAVTHNATLDLIAGAVTYTGLSSSMTGNGIVNVTLGTGSNTTSLNGDYSGFTGTINIGVAGNGKAQMTGADNAAASINVLSNCTLYVNANVTKNATVTLDGGDTGESQGQLRLEGGMSWAGKVILAGNITGSGDFTVGSNSGGGTISGEISETGGSRALSKGGSSTLILSGPNKYTGATTVGAGTLKLGSAGALGSTTVKTSGVTVAAGTLDLFGQNPTAVVPLTLNSTTNTSDVGSLYNTSATTATWPGTLTLGATTVTVGSGNIDLTGAITGGSKNINKNGTGTLALTNSGTVALALLQANRGTIQVGSGSTLNVTSIIVGSGNSVGSGLTLAGGDITSSGTASFGTATSGTASATLTLNSGTLTVPSLTKGPRTFNVNFNGGTLKASAATTTFFDAATSAKVMAGGAFIDDGGNAITIAQPLIHDSTLGITPDGGLTKSGGSTLILAGANTYIGETAVSTGTLELATTGSLTFAPGDNNISNKVTGVGTATFKGTFNIDLTNAEIVDNNSWVLADVASKSYDLTTFSVAGFTELPEGTWKFVDGSNTWTFTQSDSTLRLDVAASGYANWLTLHSTITDPAAGADPENDGIENVLEYVLNGNPMASDPSIFPDLNVTSTSFVFTFDRLDDSETDTAQTFQYGTTLGAWTEVMIGAAPSGPDVNGVTVGVVENGSAPDNITVTVPKGPNTKLFGRLQAVKLP